MPVSQLTSELFEDRQPHLFMCTLPDLVHYLRGSEHVENVC